MYSNECVKKKNCVAKKIAQSRVMRVQNLRTKMSLELDPNLKIL